MVRVTIWRSASPLAEGERIEVRGSTTKVRSGNPHPTLSALHPGRDSGGECRRNHMSGISATAPEPAFLPFASLAWFKRELAPTPARARRTAIMVAAAVLCVIISMTLQVPELSVTAYMPFFMSKESKFLTTVTGVIGFIGLTIGIAASLLLYKFTYGYPELRIPGMAITLFLGMYLSRIFVLGPLGFLIGFVVAVTQSVGEAVPHLNC